MDRAMKLSDIVRRWFSSAPAPFGLHMSEHLHKRLVAAAARRNVTISYEIMSRLERSFSQESLLSLEQLCTDMEINWARYGERFLFLELQDDLAAALAKTKDPEVATLAQAWLQVRRNSARGGV